MCFLVGWHMDFLSVGSVSRVSPGSFDVAFLFCFSDLRTSRPCINSLLQWVRPAATFPLPLSSSRPGAAVHISGHDAHLLKAMAGQSSMAAAGEGPCEVPRAAAWVATGRGPRAAAQVVPGRALLSSAGGGHLQRRGRRAPLLEVGRYLGTARAVP